MSIGPSNISAASRIEYAVVELGCEMGEDEVVDAAARRQLGGLRRGQVERVQARRVLVRRLAQEQIGTLRELQPPRTAPCHPCRRASRPRLDPVPEREDADVLHLEGVIRKGPSSNGTPAWAVMNS